MSFGTLVLVVAAYRYGAGLWDKQQTLIFLAVTLVSFCWGYCQGRADGEARKSG